MGGPALHVAYLTEGLATRGYETTLVAGTLARGEDSMQFVAERHGVEVVRVDELHREISPLRDVVAAFRLAKLIRRVRPQILHTHTAKAGAVGRLAALLAGRARPRIVVHTFHGHVLRGYFGPVRTGFFRLRERGVDALLCLVGDGPDRDALERRAHELGLVRNCLFLGYQEDVARFYAAFDVFLLASENEGTPVTTIEALAAARPVVATRVGG